MLMKLIVLIGILFGLSSPMPCAAATDTLINAAPQAQTTAFTPGAILLLPDGRQAVIMDQLDNGDFMTDLEIVISPEGVVRNGDIKGQIARLDPEFYAASTKPDSEALEAAVAPVKTPALIPTRPIKIPQIETPAPDVKVTTQTPAQKQIQKPATPLQGAQGQVKQNEPDRLTLAELLPMTNIVTGKPQTAKTVKEPAQKPEKAVPDANKAAAGKKGPVPEKAPQKPEQPKQNPKAAPQPQKEPTKHTKPKTGEEMRIPPEAIKTGNLDFLEGCWQGTRPEYYSKRTIRECFCFGASGKSGKRRIYDHGRMCIGGTRASLSQNGILSVTSSGAACNDGEKWGSAEMVCHNSGPRTPCSWKFRDANNGQQSYTIPFIRVESCGR